MDGGGAGAGRTGWSAAAPADGGGPGPVARWRGREWAGGGTHKGYYTHRFVRRSGPGGGGQSRTAGGRRGGINAGTGRGGAAGRVSACWGGGEGPEKRAGAPGAGLFSISCRRLPMRGIFLGYHAVLEKLLRNFLKFSLGPPARAVGGQAARGRA